MRSFLLVATLALAPSAVRSQSEAKACVRAYADTIALTGTLERRTYPGRPNYESVKTGDEAETGFYLVLPSPICSLHDEESGAKSTVRLIQLVLDKQGYDVLRPSLGKVVTLRGTVFGSFTGHHHAPLLLQVLQPVSIQTRERSHEEL